LTPTEGDTALPSQLYYILLAKRRDHRWPRTAGSGVNRAIHRDTQAKYGEAMTPRERLAEAERILAGAGRYLPFLEQVEAELGAAQQHEADEAQSTEG
jgi:hypothetical protein